MPSLEQVCKCLFSDSSWFAKSLVGAVLLLIPIAHFFAFGYFYEMIEQARRGGQLRFPEWGGWRRLFRNGIVAFVIFAAFFVVPLLLAWLLSLPLQLLHTGAVAYLPMVPAILLAAPLTAAGICRFQQRGEYRDAFKISALLAMLRGSKARLWVPTFALIGFLTAGYPLMTFTLFIGFAVSWTHYAVFFRAMETSGGNNL